MRRVTGIACRIIASRLLHLGEAFARAARRFDPAGLRPLTTIEALRRRASELRDTARAHLRAFDQASAEALACDKRADDLAAQARAKQQGAG